MLLNRKAELRDKIAYFEQRRCWANKHGFMYFGLAELWSTRVQKMYEELAALEEGPRPDQIQLLHQLGVDSQTLELIAAETTSVEVDSLTKQLLQQEEEFSAYVLSRWLVRMGLQSPPEELVDDPFDEMDLGQFI